jgi:predicted PurR-regulated permease PerM
MTKEPKKVEISHKTIIFAILTLIGIWLLFLVRQVILEFFAALLIMAVLNPLVTRLSKYKIPRALSVLVVYLILLGFISVTIAAIIPLLTEQTSAFINNLPRSMSSLGLPMPLSDQAIQQLLGQIGTLPASVAKATVSIFSNIFSIVAIINWAVGQEGKLL